MLRTGVHRKMFTVGNTREGGSSLLSFRRCPIDPEGTLVSDESFVVSLGPQLFSLHKSCVTTRVDAVDGGVVAMVSVRLLSASGRS